MSILRNKIGIGTVQFGVDYGISNHQGKTPLEEVEKILNYAEQNNIQYLDTAYAYGSAEETLGKFDLSKFRIVSKYISQNQKNVEEQLTTSLSRMNVNSLYGYMAHRPLDLVADNFRNLNVLRELKDSGVVQKIGASFNDLDEVKIFQKEQIHLDIIQVPYNYFDNRFENLMKEFKSNGCEIHTRSAFLQGLFFCDTEKLSSFFDEVKPSLNLIQKQENLAGKLLKFVLEKDFIDVVNIGVNNTEQLIENLQSINAITTDLPKLEVEKIDTKILVPSGWPK